jgi:hypothetical protein
MGTPPTAPVPRGAPGRRDPRRGPASQRRRGHRPAQSIAAARRINRRSASRVTRDTSTCSSMGPSGARWLLWAFSEPFIRSDLRALHRGRRRSRLRASAAPARRLLRSCSLALGRPRPPASRRSRALTDTPRRTNSLPIVHRWRSPARAGIALTSGPSRPGTTQSSQEWTHFVVSRESIG